MNLSRTFRAALACKWQNTRLGYRNQLAACSLSLRVLPGYLPACCPYCPAGSVQALERSSKREHTQNISAGGTRITLSGWDRNLHINRCDGQWQGGEWGRGARWINIWLLAIFSWQNNRRHAASYQAATCCESHSWNGQQQQQQQFGQLRIANCELRMIFLGSEARELAMAMELDACTIHWPSGHLVCNQVAWQQQQLWP